MTHVHITPERHVTTPERRAAEPGPLTTAANYQPLQGLHALRHHVLSFLIKNRNALGKKKKKKKKGINYSTAEKDNSPVPEQLVLVFHQHGLVCDEALKSPAAETPQLCLFYLSCCSVTHRGPISLPLMTWKASLCSSLTGNESSTCLCPSGDLRAPTCYGQTGQKQRLEHSAAVTMPI